MMGRTIIAMACVAVLTAGCVSTAPRTGGPNLEKAARINLKLGVAYMQQGRLKLAIRKLKRAIRQDPQLAAADTALARLYVRRGNMHLARKYYEKALDIAGGNPKVQNAYGVFLCRHGKAGESIQHFLRAVNDPNYLTDAAAYTNAGMCALEVGRAADAERYFRRALEIKPTYVQALWQLAQLTFKQGHYFHTRAFLQRFMAANHHPPPEVLWLAARAESKLGSEAHARQYANRLIAHFPDSELASRARKMTNNDN